MQFSSKEEEAEARRFADIAMRAETIADRRIRREIFTPTPSPLLSSKVSCPAKCTDLKKRKGEESMTIFSKKEERENAALERWVQKKTLHTAKKAEEKLAYDRFVTGKKEEEKQREARRKKEEGERLRKRRSKESNKNSDETDQELKVIREHYLGGVVTKKKALFVPCLTSHCFIEFILFLYYSF